MVGVEGGVRRGWHRKFFKLYSLQKHFRIKASQNHRMLKSRHDFGFYFCKKIPVYCKCKLASSESRCELSVWGRLCSDRSYGRFAASPVHAAREDLPRICGSYNKLTNVT